MLPSSGSEFVPGQIAYLRSADQVLYVEIIEHLPHQARCWARPLAIRLEAAADPPDQLSQIVLLPDSPDIILPAHLFTAALDTEYLDILGALTAKRATEAAASAPSAQYVQQFIRTLLATN